LVILDRSVGRILPRPDASALPQIPEGSCVANLGIRVLVLPFGGLYTAPWCSPGLPRWWRPCRAKGACRCSNIPRRLALSISELDHLVFLRDPGFMTNADKSRLEVSQRFEHLGPADYLVAKVFRQVPPWIPRLSGSLRGSFPGPSVCSTQLRDSSSWVVSMSALSNTGWPGVGLRKT
jgi:hypothetical protein